ncbi:TolC family protein [Sediminibacterium sp.]|jgi:outer membrane protein TolC|uniref:TolC family protein n=1 Tax=Sediminibacterium sp. TaxID=1917865 RepID=UPI002730A850|nr:TolC family protein [Sediminibacterium sp.]MDP1973616.1 TolC family protein [Sediminibacterium sp.]MDP2419825.1 TolC family protein [Sediminibacterium sp.]
MRKLILLVFLGTISAEIGYSQNRLSLSDAVAIALKNSYNIQLAKNNVEIATINNHLGIAGGLPTVNATINDVENITTINQKFPDPSRDVTRSGVSSNNMNSNVTAGILLFNGFRVKAAKQRLDELQKMNQDMLNAQIQSTMASVITSYYDVVRQQNLLSTINKSIEVSQQRIDIINSRKEVGLANNADLYQAQIDLNALVQSKQAQQLIIDQGKTNLLSLIFVSPDSSVVINDTIVVDEKINFSQLKTLALKNPQVLAAEQQIKINELIERETAALRVPTLRANTGFNFSNTKSGAGFILENRSYGPFLGINLAIPIYNGLINKKQQQVAEINTRNAKVQRDQFLLDIETGAVRTYQAYANTLAQLKTAKQNQLLSKQLLDLVMQRFQLGQATIIDVKLAQQSFENESYRLVNLAFTAKVAEIELKRLANIIEP